MCVPLSEFVWGQEEPENMGAWQFVEPRFRRQLGIQVRPLPLYLVSYYSQTYLFTSICMCKMVWCPLSIALANITVISISPYCPTPFLRHSPMHSCHLLAVQPIPAQPPGWPRSTSQRSRSCSAKPSLSNSSTHTHHSKL